MQSPRKQVDGAAPQAARGASREREVEALGISIDEELHLVEEICTRIVIIDRGIKVADGTVVELSAQAEMAGAGSNLEEIFLKVTARES